jgi:5-methylcytosine-specific restriction protein B
MYELSEGVFKRIATKARDNAGNYVLVIDEINRGNIPKIFGELITLIEEDKREGADSEVRTTLPYSKEEFSVPANLHIIGTMNSVDRSIALMDVALRRRFVFEEFMPEYEETRLNESDVDGLNLGRLLLAINERIEIMLDRDHQAGQSFFVKVNNSVDRKKTLYDTWYRELIPLFQEYFYNDYEKLEQLLGKYKDKDGIESGFIEKKRRDEIERIIGTAEGAFSDTYVGSIHRYDDPDALISALKRYVA